MENDNNNSMVVEDIAEATNANYKDKLIKEYFILRDRYLYMKREHQNVAKGSSSKSNNAINEMHRFVSTFTRAYFESEREASFRALKLLIRDMLFHNVDFIGEMLITKDEMPLNDTRFFFPRFVPRQYYYGYS